MEQNPWRASLLSQLVWHWDNQLRPRLEGLADDEYLWRPEPDAWTVRHVDDAEPGTTLGLGPGVIDFTFPQLSPPR